MPPWRPEQQRRALWLCLGAIIAITLDQWTKAAIVDRFILGESIPVIGEWIKLTLVHNYGVAFGFLNHASELQHYLLTTFNICVVLMLIAMALWMPLARIERFCVSLIACGAIGNIIDRFNHGYVIDFIDVGLPSARWPVFNIADSCVSIGVTIWIISALLTTFITLRHQPPSA